MITINKASLLTVSPDQVSANLTTDQTGHVVILDLKRGIYYEVSDVAARVWELVQQPSPFDAILQTLLKEYDVSADRCEADLVALIQDMANRGLVDVRDGPHSQLA
jgi:uncharacterized surface anchored protein